MRLYSAIDSCLAYDVSGVGNFDHSTGNKPSINQKYPPWSYKGKM